MIGFVDIYGFFRFDLIKLDIKKCYMDFILNGG